MICADIPAIKRKIPTPHQKIAVYPNFMTCGMPEPMNVLPSRTRLIAGALAWDRNIGAIIFILCG
jgi:hypothetical protein